MARFYEPPEDVAGTVFDPNDETFGPIMAALQRGDFADAADLVTELAASSRGWVAEGTIVQLRDVQIGYSFNVAPHRSFVLLDGGRVQLLDPDQDTTDKIWTIAECGLLWDSHVRVGSRVR